MMKLPEDNIYQCQHCDERFSTVDVYATYDWATDSMLCPGCGSAILVNELEEYRSSAIMVNELEKYRLSCTHHPMCKWMCTALKCPYHSNRQSELDKMLDDTEQYGSIEMSKYPVTGTLKTESEITAYWAGYIASIQSIRNKLRQGKKVQDSGDLFIDAINKSGVSDESTVSIGFIRMKLAKFR